MCFASIRASDVIEAALAALSGFDANDTVDWAETVGTMLVMVCGLERNTKKRRIVTGQVLLGIASIACAPVTKN
jgi:hypothetical protein